MEDPLLGFLLPVFVVASSLWLHVIQYLSVSEARKIAKVPYPHLYVNDAEKGTLEYKFNCVQRAHQQLLENLPTFIASTLIFGSRWPYIASLNGIAWIFARFAYYRGYATGDPRRREKGAKIGNSSLLFQIIGATIAPIVMYVFN